MPKANPSGSQQGQHLFSPQQYPEVDMNFSFQQPLQLGKPGAPSGTAGGPCGTPGGPSGTAGGLFSTLGGPKGTTGGPTGTAGVLFGTPGGPSGTPGGLFGTPGGSKGTAGGLFGTPGGSKGTTGGLFGTPGGSKGTAGGLFSTPGGSKGTAGGLFGTPGGPSGTAGGLFSTLGGPKGTSGGLFGTPEGPSGTPGGLFGTPGGSKGTPGGLFGTPGGPKGTSGGLFGTPEGPSGTPGGLFGTPGGSKGTPGGLFGTPGGSKGTAGGPFGTPGGPSCTAGGPLGTPGGQVRSPPSQPVGEGDLTKNFNSITLNPPPPGENRGQQRTKGIELHLSSQYEEKVRPCLDLIDSLRALGVEQDLDLPAIAVIGDQSSGKSSVLEALSGVALPRGSGIVTRCPLVLKLRKVSSELQWKGKISYQNSELQLRDPSQVEREILKAQNSIAGHGVGISHELISLEISSSDVPDLTLIDLPGITRIAVGDQPTDIGMQIKTLIRKYIQKQQTINLVVVPCNVDIATTEALSMAQEVDPDGDRTIGILTKPDLVDKGAEKIIVNVVQNLTYHLKKGYMIVKCRGQQEIIDKLSLAEATKKEKAFFQAHPYFRSLLQEGKATVPCLAERLTTELVSHITKSLPLLENQIRENHQSAMEELCHCGENVPSNDTDKMIFLVEKIKMFNQDIEKLVEGEEIVKETETRLFNKLREEFKNWGFILGNNTQQVKNVIHEETSKYENQYRGKELLGFINYKTFETIVRQYVEQLVDPALSMLTKITELTWQTFADTAKKHFDEFSNLNRAALNKIEDIKTKQAEMAVDMIRLQFRMEKLVYCQDQIYSSILQKIREENYNPLRTAPQAQESSISALTEIGLHLNSYFWETSKRLSNQIPFIIQYCMLQENGDLLQKAMMQLLQEKEQYSWLLQERSETAHKRRILKEKIYRLTQARQALIKLSC